MVDDPADHYVIDINEQQIDLNHTDTIANNIEKIREVDEKFDLDSLLHAHQNEFHHEEPITCENLTIQILVTLLAEIYCLQCGCRLHDGYICELCFKRYCFDCLCSDEEEDTKMVKKGKFINIELCPVCLEICQKSNEE